MLAKVLGECKTLAHLDLSGNRIGAEGAGTLCWCAGGTSLVRGERGCWRECFWSARRWLI
eukprot:3895027-Rhodomonas_salina.1